MEVSTAETTPLKGSKRITYPEGLQMGEGEQRCVDSFPANSLIIVVIFRQIL